MIETSLQDHILCFLQVERLTCPLMYIVGEDDLSSSAIENANLVDWRIFLLFVFLVLFCFSQFIEIMFDQKYRIVFSYVVFEHLSSKTWIFKLVSRDFLLNASVCAC